MRLFVFIILILPFFSVQAGLEELKQSISIFHEARDNFEYVTDQDNEVRIYTDIESGFSGDCEDFAYSLAMKIGGTVWFTFNEKKQAHAVVLSESGFVFDNEKEWPMRQDVYPNKLLFKLRFSHFDTVLLDGELIKSKS
ncbi:hypothetical protein [Corallincola spongiicola]|uniref:Uncharacterized protein n=1 Tax=Corallincola spongiicola TaxID=2520508 RepID=A0ABY1WV75_9GAMM|nr:hypothetical protein [Corallincola spongiicola]TAA48614.1 hypothetical protein EXY25_05190 [Corallincola spongiicola]